MRPLPLPGEPDRNRPPDPHPIAAALPIIIWQRMQHRHRTHRESSAG